MTTKASGSSLVTCPTCHGAGRVPGRQGAAQTHGDQPYIGGRSGEACQACRKPLAQHHVREVGQHRVLICPKDPPPLASPAPPAPNTALGPRVGIER